jgi:hypothetical protein
MCFGVLTECDGGEDIRGDVPQRVERVVFRVGEGISGARDRGRLSTFGDSGVDGENDAKRRRQPRSHDKLRSRRKRWGIEEDVLQLGKLQDMVFWTGATARLAKLPAILCLGRGNSRPAYTNLNITFVHHASTPLRQAQASVWSTQTLVV